MQSESYSFKRLMGQLAKITNFQSKPMDRFKKIPESFIPDMFMASEDDKILQPDGSYVYKPRIIVDKRELRSMLPGALYFGGFNVIPMWLTYGDYIVSDNIVIERKALADFV
jgi:hypothetical protein